MNAKDEYGNTPLIEAVQYSGNLAVITALLKAGAEVNAKDEYENMPLHLAVGNNNLKVITALLKAGAEVNAKDEYGNTALHTAASFSRNPAIVTTLLAAGADVSVHRSGVQTKTPLQAAAFSNTQAVVAALLKGGADVNEQTEHTRYTALHFAAKNNDLAVVSALLKAGALVNAKDINDETPLHYAAKRERNQVYYQKNPEVITALLAAGADPHARDVSGDTPSQLVKERPDAAKFVAAFSAEAVAAFREKERKAAAAARKREIEQRLRAARVSCGKWNTSGFFRHAGLADVFRCLKTKNPNARNQYGETPLHLAAKFSKTPAVVAALAKGGVDLKAQDQKGRTPLHTAAVFSETPAVVTALIGAGADLSAKDKKGRTPLQFAEKFSKTPAVVTALKQAVAEKNKKARAAAKAAAGKRQVEPGLRAEGVSCETWNTPAFFRRAVLAKAGAEVNARDARGGWTPLHLAAWFSKTPAVVAALLAVGADPAARDKADKTPWDYAKANAALEGTAPYWRLNEERFR